MSRAHPEENRGGGLSHDGKKESEGFATRGKIGLPDPFDVGTTEIVSGGLTSMTPIRVDPHGAGPRQPVYMPTPGRADAKRDR